MNLTKERVKRKVSVKIKWQYSHTTTQKPISQEKDLLIPCYACLKIHKEKESWQPHDVNADYICAWKGGEVTQQHRAAKYIYLQ